MHPSCYTLVSLALAVRIAIVGATPVFQNKGTKEDASSVGSFRGWDQYNHEDHGTVDQVDNVYLEGPTALKMIQTYDPSWTGRYHSEAIKLNAYTIGNQGFYGFAFRLASDWDTTAGQTYNIAQFIADFTNDKHNTCNEDFLPSMMMWVEGDQLRTRRKGNNMCGPWTTNYDYEVYTVGTITPGQFYRVVIQANWQSTPTGFYKVWLDGVKKVEEYDIITTYIDEDKQHHFQFSVGLYANSWHDQHKLIGQGTRQVWIDEVGIGSEFKDADSTQWA